MLLRLGIILLLLASCSISGPLREDKIASNYTFPEPMKGWTKLIPTDGVEVLYQEKSGALLSVSSLCGRYEEAKLEALARSALSPLEKFKEIEMRDFELDGRQALQIYGEGRVDGVLAQIDFVVWRKNDCIFDFSLQASPKLTSKVRTDFLAMLKKFRYPK